VGGRGAVLLFPPSRSFSSFRPRPLRYPPRRPPRAERSSPREPFDQMSGRFTVRQRFALFSPILLILFRCAHQLYCNGGRSKHRLAVWGDLHDLVSTGRCGMPSTLEENGILLHAAQLPPTKSNETLENTPAFPAHFGCCRQQFTDRTRTMVRCVASVSSSPPVKTLHCKVLRRWDGGSKSGTRQMKSSGRTAQNEMRM
jgi:hypothetical protein